MSARKRQRRAVITESESESESDIAADGGLATAPLRHGRLRRAGDKAAAAGKDVIDLCDEPHSAARAAAPPVAELTPQQPARQPEAPATLRRSGLRQRVANSKKAPQRAALERLQRLRSGGGALGEACIVLLAVRHGWVLGA